MTSLDFDNKTFNQKYAFPFTVTQRILAVGFSFILVVLLLPANSITIPDAVLPLSCILLLVSLVGFPIVTITKHGYRKLLRESELTIDDGRVKYKLMTEKMWTVVGHVEEYSVYDALKTDSVRTSKRYYICSGTFQKITMNNGRQLKCEQVSMMRIPRAYTNMERIKHNGE